MAARRLLVTGFGPFPTMPRNPSGRLATKVATSPRWRLHAVEPRARILTTAYRCIGGELDPALHDRPDLLLMVGVAGRSKAIRVEWRATSRRSTLFPDVAGERASQPETGKRKTVLRTRLPAQKALRTLRQHHLPSRLSRDAGRYLCNAAYHRALEAGIPVLFIHIPKSPNPRRPGPWGRAGSWEERLAAALVDVAIGLLRDARLLAAR